MIDELIDQIEQVLQAHTEGLSEYELLSALKSAPEGLLDELDMQDAHALFQAHFLVFHCLYRLRDRWLAEARANLQIDVFKIISLPYVEKLSDELAVADELRAYYLDLNNLEQTSADDAENLINQFWQKFVAQPDRLNALKVLELEEPVSFERIQQKYRQLVMQYHPDRGGSAGRLADINQAMDTLKRYYQ